MNKFNITHAGFSLIELVIAIVILSIGATAFITLVINTTKNSIDPQIRQQGNAISRAYLEEIILNSFCEPGFDPDGDPATGCAVECLVAACSTGAPNACGGANAVGGAEAGRAVFDDVCDYHGLTDVGAVDQNGNTLGMLGNYTVSVTVNDTGVSLSSLNGSNGQVVRIDVSVIHSTGATMGLSAYKTNF
tara:strand:- start:1791 stop:2360 length:570 start_codon:yes stop_codon:yes gene_type:complete